MVGKDREDLALGLTGSFETAPRCPAAFLHTQDIISLLHHNRKTSNQSAKRRGLDNRNHLSPLFDTQFTHRFRDDLGHQRLPPQSQFHSYPVVHPKMSVTRQARRLRALVASG